MRKFVVMGIVSMIAVASVGCGDLFNSHIKVVDEVRGLATTASSRLGESGLGQVSAAAHANNPGVRTSIGVEYYAEARYVGLDGSFSSAMQGPLDRNVPDELQSRIMDIYQATDINAQQKAQKVWELITTYIQSAKEEDESAPTQDGVTSDSGSAPSK